MPSWFSKIEHQPGDQHTRKTDDHISDLHDIPYVIIDLHVRYRGRDAAGEFLDDDVRVQTRLLWW